MSSIPVLFIQLLGTAMLRHSLSWHGVDDTMIYLSGGGSNIALVEKLKSPLVSAGASLF